MIETVLAWVVSALVGLALLKRAARDAVASDAAVAVVDRASSARAAVADREQGPCPQCGDPAPRPDDCADCPPTP